MNDVTEPLIRARMLDPDMRVTAHFPPDFEIKNLIEVARKTINLFLDAIEGCDLDDTEVLSSIACGADFPNQPLRFQSYSNMHLNVQVYQSHKLINIYPHNARMADDDLEVAAGLDERMKQCVRSVRKLLSACDGVDFDPPVTHIAYSSKPKD